MATYVAPGPGSLASARPDPLGPVLDLGRRDVQLGTFLGLFGALALHIAAAAHATASLLPLRLFAERVHAAVYDRQLARIDIDEIEAPPPEPEPEQPLEKTEPEDSPKAQPTTAPKSDGQEAPPPAAAEAGKLLTQEPSADDPLDLTDQGFVTGDGDRYAGGTTAASGTSKTAVTDPRARGGGKPGATGTKPGATGTGPAPAGKDASRPAVPTSRNWNCGFPPEADFDQIDFATVMISVTVDVSGRAKSVTVLSDPGHGFGRLARSCAMRMQYTPGFDRNGNPVVKTTSPFPVRFTR